MIAQSLQIQYSGSFSPEYCPWTVIFRFLYRHSMGFVWDIQGQTERHSSRNRSNLSWFYTPGNFRGLKRWTVSGCLQGPLCVWLHSSFMPEFSLVSQSLLRRSPPTTASLWGQCITQVMRTAFSPNVSVSVFVVSVSSCCQNSCCSTNSKPAVMWLLLKVLLLSLIDGWWCRAGCQADSVIVTIGILVTTLTKALLPRLPSLLRQPILTKSWRVCKNSPSSHWLRPLCRCKHKGLHKWFNAPALIYCHFIAWLLSWHTLWIVGLIKHGVCLSKNQSCHFHLRHRQDNQSKQDAPVWGDTREQVRLQFWIFNTFGNISITLWWGIGEIGEQQ